MNIAVLGSTGSIGTQTLEAARVLDGVRVVGLAGHSNVDLIERQAVEFGVPIAAMQNEAAALELKRRMAGRGVNILSGDGGVLEIARLCGANMVVNALSGCAGLIPTVEALKAGKDVALANKESLVAGGAFVTELSKEFGGKLITIDSEHAAVCHCIEGGTADLAKIYLTASGGPFRTYTAEQLENVTVEDALKHPTWSMGSKITVDSATLMNKGLEIIEAMWLFDVAPDMVDVVVHPQSIIHALVEFNDGTLLAQLAAPDMRLPVLHALSRPQRAVNPFAKLNLFDLAELTFERPKRDLFPCLGLTEAAARTGGNMPAVLNAANEAAVVRFLSGEIPFTKIPALIENCMSAYTLLNETVFSLETVVYYSGWAMERTSRDICCSG